ncbi:MAG: response regulator transcription factor [Burkholderiales bacterium]|jgi:two-component system OmpR family response regulator/two-component system response regulator QseB|nr:response regulator transcription factor [Burkholderiales bacterium]
MRILLVEDDVSLGDAVAAWLRLDGYAVDWLTRGDQAELALKTHSYDAVLLDRGLPGQSGDVVLRTLRTHGSSLPVLMITARDTVPDRIEGLDLGADDYLVKPFDLTELSARIRAALRRRHPIPETQLKFGAVTIDPAAKQAWVDDTLLVLTAREFSILHALVLAKGRPQSRAQLEETLYGWNEEIESNAVEVHIHHLRRKLGNHRIRTLRQLGYALSP